MHSKRGISNLNEGRENTEFESCLNGGYQVCMRGNILVFRMA